MHFGISRVNILGGSLGLFLIIYPNLAPAVTIQVGASADTTLIETNPDHNMGAQYFFNAGTTGINTKNRSLLQFDLTSLIPPGSTILAVDLSLEVVGVPDGNQGVFSLFGLHRVLQPWGEGNKIAENPFSPGLGEDASPGEATWNDRLANNASWSAPGGAADLDYVATPSTLTFVGGEDLYDFESSPALVEDVQGWIDHPQDNFGWMLISDAENTRFTARRFASREDAFAGPILTIEFQPVPEPTTALLWASGLGVLAWFYHQSPSRRRLDPNS